MNARTVAIAAVLACMLVLSGTPATSGRTMSPEKYTESVGKIMGAVDKSLNRLSNASDDLANGSLESDDYLRLLRTEQTRLHTLGARAARMQPPEAFASSHAILLAAIDQALLGVAHSRVCATTLDVDWCTMAQQDFAEMRATAGLAVPAASSTMARLEAERNMTMEGGNATAMPEAPTPAPEANATAMPESATTTDGYATG